MPKIFSSFLRLVKSAASAPETFAQALNAVSSVCSGYEFTRGYTDNVQQAANDSTPATPSNPLWKYFQNYTQGPGIFKWEHYFDIYNRHLARFVGQKVDVLEIGIFGGGSLEMWRSYFGQQSRIYGVDINPACKAYENDHTTIFIGDQENRDFWITVKKNIGAVDVLIDDGGHSPEQQQVTLEEMLPNLRPGGVYLCEDVHALSKSFNRFAAYAAGLVHGLNRTDLLPTPLLQSTVSTFQRSIQSIHFYPSLLVIEKHRVPPARFAAPRHGTHFPAP